MNHYVYLITDDLSSNYIGVRSCKCLIQDDTKYWGSSKYNPPNMRDTHNKIILKRFDTRKEANKYEHEMHKLFDVSKNDQFWNKCESKGGGFPFGVTNLDPETINRLAFNRRDHTLYDFYHETYGIVLSTMYDLRIKYTLDTGDLSKVVSGKNLSTKGWVLLNGEDPTIVINKIKPKIYNLTHDIYGAFVGRQCDLVKKYKLQQSGVYNVCAGNTLAYRGWRLKSTLLVDTIISFKGRDNPNYDHTIYDFHHLDYGVIKCTQYHLKLNYPVSKHTVHLLCHNKVNIYHGWSILSSTQKNQQD